MADSEPMGSESSAAGGSQTPAHDRAFYRRAAEDLYNNRPTADAKALHEELVAAIRAGKAKANLWLLMKGTPGKWMNAAIDGATRAVQAGNQEELRKKLTEAAADWAAGRTDTPNLTFALQFTGNKIDEDPRPSVVAPQLKAAGCTEEFTAYLLSNQTTRTRQKSSATLFLAGGLVVVGIGLLMQRWYGPIWQGSNREITDSPLIIVLVGAVVAGKGLLGLRKAKSKAL